jgi:hypothetical protein
MSHGVHEVEHHIEYQQRAEEGHGAASRARKATEFNKKLRSWFR